MGLRDLNDAIDALAAQRAAQADLFAVGKCTDIDVSTSPHTYTIAGRAMPCLNAGASEIARGDLVVYVDQAAPFALDKYAGA